MSINFIKERVGYSDIEKARRQQKQLRQFTVSNVQEDITVEYLNQYVNRNFRTEGDFLNWVKVIFKTDNFLSFYKYYRTPSPASALINDQIVPALTRVFYSDDSEFSYTIKGQSVEEPESLQLKKFKDKIFRALLFNYNDILIHDLDGINKPFRELVSIENVVAIDSHDSVIHRIAYTSCITSETGEKIHGYTYMDAERYAFYETLNSEVPLLESFHDLEECPADYITPHSFSEDDVVRKGFLSYAKEKLEEYDFLKTLQKLTEPSNAFPVQAKIKTNNTKADNENIEAEPMSSGSMPKSSGSDTQAGAVIDVSLNDIRDETGKINMDVIEKFVTYFRAPVDILDFIDKRIGQIKNDLIEQILGDYKQKNEDRRNELDVKSGLITMEDRLRAFSMQLSRIQTISDTKMLALEYGKDNVETSSFFGSDFYLQSEGDLYKMFDKSPNVIERKNILKKISSTRHKHSKNRAERDKILYELIPFVSDKDFDYSKDTLDEVTFLYQTRFNYWISQFESTYGDIVEFYNVYKSDISLGYNDSEIISFINNLVLDFIKDYKKQNEQREDSSQIPSNQG